MQKIHIILQKHSRKLKEGKSEGLSDPENSSSNTDGVLETEPLSVTQHAARGRAGPTEH